MCCRWLCSVFCLFFLLPFHIQESRGPNALLLCMSALLAITAAFGSLQIRKAEYWERKHAFLLYGKCFVGDIWWYFFKAPFPRIGKTESQIRVCIICLFLHWQFFVDRCHTSCKCLLKMLMVFVVLCFLALSWLRKAESQTRVCLVCARYLQQKQPNATCASRMPVHAGSSNCYHCALRPVC